ncbi:MAG: hypothetical protein DHS20C17_27600 [Cyclobacteriaceae bacterium]|nr:MAG: hypothetical protein DHS20C17_27600 [Cyclobacteriaceae bacterium]
MKRLLLLTTTILITVVIGFAQESSEGEGYVGENNDLIQRSLDLEQTVEVYPNPAVDFLNIDVKGEEVVRVDFEVYDIIGNSIEVRPEKLTTNKYRVPVGDLHSGYYMLIVKDPYSRYRQIFKFGKR